MAQRIVKVSANIGQYAKIFDARSPMFQSTSHMNMFFLMSIQQQANEMLAQRGHVFLNEVHDLLGLPRTQIGQIVGWSGIIGSDNNANRIDFGLAKLTKEEIASNDSFNLDFNVDGVIYNLIEK